MSDAVNKNGIMRIFLPVPGEREGMWKAGEPRHNVHHPRPPRGAPRAVTAEQTRALEWSEPRPGPNHCERLDVIEWFERAGTTLWNHTQDVEANHWMLECETAVREVQTLTGYAIAEVTFFPNKSGDWVVKSIMKSLLFVKNRLRGAWGISAEADAHIRVFHRTAKNVLAKFDDAYKPRRYGDVARDHDEFASRTEGSV